MPSNYTERDSELLISFHTLHDTDILVISHIEATSHTEYASFIIFVILLGTFSISTILF